MLSRNMMSSTVSARRLALSSMRSQTLGGSASASANPPRFGGTQQTQTQQLRYKSASVASTDTAGEQQKQESSAGCPFTGSKAVEHPTLQNVRKLPFFGSMVHQFSGTPPFVPSKMYEYEVKMREKFGEFYSMGFPIFGRGVFGEAHSITNPNEMLKVIRAEGAYPSGLVNFAWSFIQGFRDDKSAMMGDGADNGLLGQGERWKQQRTFLQTGMLDPRSANGFIPGIVTAAQLASQGAPAAGQKKELNYYLNLCAFDMFSSFMFGELTNCAQSVYPAQNDPRNNHSCSAAQEENMTFCKAAIHAMETGAEMGREPMEGVAHNVFGYKTKRYNEFYDSWKLVRQIAMKKLHGFIDRYEADKESLTELERNSYMYNAMERLGQGADGNGKEKQITKEEMLELCMFALFVGVDTTSGVTAWNLVHVGINPRVQEKLYQELAQATEASGGQLTHNSLSKKNVPYLHACIKENYRLTPPFGAATFKRASQGEVEIHGLTLPKDSMVMLKNKFSDPVYLEDAREFRPERWSNEEVASRVGTPLEDMDHALFRDNFGQGARRCPGSRVATNEVLSMIAQLVLDYDIRPPSGVKTLEDVKYGMSALICPNLPAFEFIPRQTRTEEDEQRAA